MKAANRLSPDEAKRLGASLRAARDSQQVSREELGRRVQLSMSRIQQYEKGSHKANGTVIIDAPPAPMLAAIAEALDTTPSAILNAAGLSGVEIPALEPIGPGEPKEMTRIRDAADKADIIDLRIVAAKESWAAFVAQLSPAARSELLTLMVSGRTSSS